MTFKSWSRLMRREGAYKSYAKNQKRTNSILINKSSIVSLSDQHQRSYPISDPCVNIWRPQWSFRKTCMGHTMTFKTIDLVIWQEQATIIRNRRLSWRNYLSPWNTCATRTNYCKASCTLYRKINISLHQGLKFEILFLRGQVSHTISDN